MLVARLAVDSHVQLVSMGLAATTALTAGFFAYLYGKKQEPYLGPWALAWILVALRALLIAMAPMLGPSAWVFVPNSLLLKFGGLAFLWSAWEYTQKPVRLVWLGAGALALAAWSTAADLHKIRIPASFGTAAVLLCVGSVFFLSGRKKKTIPEQLMALGFVLWAPIPVLGIYLGVSGSQAQYNLALLAGAPQLFIAVTMLMLTYEKENQWTESNLLALSNLTLVTSGLMGGEMQVMLAQVLDGVLSTLRMPAGAILLHHGDSKGPTSFISVGLDEAFCSALQQESLDDYLAELPAQADDPAVSYDLEHEDDEAPLPRDERFERFRRMAAGRGLRNVMIASLQNKEKNFGALVLASPEGKRLSKAEIFLTKELSRQIAMAIENCYLIQQTWRRSEELRVLNEIGRALSSTLDPDALFEKIFTEVQRLFNPTHFYIALYDASRNELRFELEVTEGVRLPKRTRPMGNHLAEYILRTSRPLLIREKFEETIRKLGVQTQGQPGSFCGVPLIAYDRAIGVMAVRGTEERIFDEGHLEMMRVLASEASIAIENARLFREEQTKSRHLALLNNISRNAISTLNPEEMLANIAEQLRQGTGLRPHGHRAARLRQQRSGGAGGGGPPPRGAGQAPGAEQVFVGRVARTGRMSVARDFAEETTSRPVLENSASGVALPILYAEQLHGVLYVETADPREFSEEDLLLLHTLADLISGALHNALAFQKAQEQAITDGLTGVKTHRFFMEALSAEWKRSTRAGRPFSLALIDLDRFKFVNDFHGHLEGDLVLKRVGQVLEQGCRALGRGGALRRRRIRDSDAGDRRRAGAATRRRSCARSIFADLLLQRKKHHREPGHGQLSRCTDRRRRN